MNHLAKIIIVNNLIQQSWDWRIFTPESRTVTAGRAHVCFHSAAPSPCLTPGPRAMQFKWQASHVRGGRGKGTSGWERKRWRRQCIRQVKDYIVANERKFRYIWGSVLLTTSLVTQSIIWPFIYEFSYTSLGHSDNIIYRLHLVFCIISFRKGMFA